MIYTILKTALMSSLILACGGGSSSDETVADGNPVAEDILDKAGDVVVAPNIEIPKTPTVPELPKEEVDNGFDNLLNLASRKSIDFNTTGQVISVPHNEKFDAWSNNKAYTWSFNIVKDSSDGTKMIPIVSRGQSVYSVKIDFTNEFFQMEGADASTSHLSTVPFSNLNFIRAADGSVNLPVTITRSALGIEKWYLSTSLVKTFYNLSTDDTVESEAILIGSASGVSEEFQGQLDMVSFWDKELSLEEIIELVTEYDPRDHSAYSTYAVSVWPLGEDLAVDGNSSGAAVYDIRSGLHASTTNIDDTNFVDVDLTEYSAVVVDNYTTLTNTVISASDASPIDGATITLIGADGNHTANSDASGVYTFTDIPKKLYALQVSAAGFSTYLTNFDSASSNYITLSPEITDSGDNDFRIVATWDADPVDLDFFCLLYNDFGALIGMITSSGSYADGEFTASVENNATSGYGPDTMVINNLPEDYLFKVLLSNYSGGVTVDTDAMVKIYKGNSLLGEYRVANVQNPSSAHKNFFEVGVYNDSIFHPELSYVLTP
jgi:hypothetical protein